MRRLAVALVLCGCGTASGVAAPPPGESPAPTLAPVITSAPVPAPTPDRGLAEVEPALAAPHPPLAATMPGAARSALAEGPAFVIGMFDVPDGETLLVPVDPATPLRSTEALLLQSDAPSWVVAIVHAESRHAESACVCGPELHGFARVQVDPSTFETEQRDCTCARPENAADTSDEEESGEEDEDSDDEDCLSEWASLRSIVGGRAFLPMDRHSACDGWNSYALDLTTFAVPARAWAEPTWPSARTFCDGGEASEWGDFDRALSSDACARGPRGHFSADCGFCSDEPTFVMVTEWNGMLHYTGASVRSGANGGGPMWRAETPLRPRNCPSASDPCGDPTHFASVLPTDARARFWIATDGSVALVLTTEAHSATRVRMFRPDEPNPSRDLTLPFALGAVISVRFHANAAPMARVIDHGLEAIEASTRAPELTSLSPAAVPAEACAIGQRRIEDGSCASIPLDPTDDGFVDTHAGSGWGERCTLHLRAGALDAAEAACARGLTTAERPTTRGALFYNLGRIAEGRGDRAAARRAYEQSLASRPGNEPTMRALTALGEP